MQVECGTIILIIWMFQIVFGKLITVNGKRFWIVLYVSLILFLACSFRNIFYTIYKPFTNLCKPRAYNRDFTVPLPAWYSGQNMSFGSMVQFPSRVIICKQVSKPLRTCVHTWF